jgi:hypothetical protein
MRRILVRPIRNMAAQLQLLSEADDWENQQINVHDRRELGHLAMWSTSAPNAFWKRRISFSTYGAFSMPGWRSAPGRSARKSKSASTSRPRRTRWPRA